MNNAWIRFFGGLISFFTPDPRGGKKGGPTDHTPFYGTHKNERKKARKAARIARRQQRPSY